MGVTETVFGKPPQTTINQTPATRPPGYSFARDFFNSLSNVAQQPYPTYQGQLDPGMSPTMANTIRRAQGYGTSGPPEILAGVQGSLGRFMNPSFINPAFRVQGGAPDYANQNPNQRVFGGRTAGNLGSAFGVSGPTYASKLPGAGGGSNVPVAFGGPPPGAPPPAGGMKDGGGTAIYQDMRQNPVTGQWEGRGPDNQFSWERAGTLDYQNPVSGADPGRPMIDMRPLTLPPGMTPDQLVSNLLSGTGKTGTSVSNPGMAWDPYASPNGGLESITGGGLMAPEGGNLGNDMLEAPGSQNPPQRFIDMAMRYGPEYAAQRWRDFQAGQLPGQQQPTQVFPAPNAPPAFGGTYGGYTAQQLQADPSLVANLGQRGLSRWNAAGGAVPPAFGGPRPRPTGPSATPGVNPNLTKPQLPPAFQPRPPQSSPWK